MTDKNKTSYRTTLGRVRGLGSARDGTHHWWMQRVTSIALIPLSAFFLYNLNHLITPEYGRMMMFLSKPHVTILLMMFILSAYYHAYLGIQVIIEDYVHCHATKTASILFNKLFFFALTVTALYAVAIMGFNFANFAVQID